MVDRQRKICGRPAATGSSIKRKAPQNPALFYVEESKFFWYNIFIVFLRKCFMMFRCPVCREPLQRQEKQYRCKSGHSFDIARSGYVNLLLDNGRGRHGDDKKMVAARSAFLEKGFYRPRKLPNLRAAGCLSRQAWVSGNTETHQPPPEPLPMSDTSIRTF